MTIVNLGKYFSFCSLLGVFLIIIIAFFGQIRIKMLAKKKRKKKKGGGGVPIVRPTCTPDQSPEFIKAHLTLNQYCFFLLFFKYFFSEYIDIEIMNYRE